MSDFEPEFDNFFFQNFSQRTPTDHKTFMKNTMVRKERKKHNFLYKQINVKQYSTDNDQNITLKYQPLHNIDYSIW